MEKVALFSAAPLNIERGRIMGSINFKKLESLLLNNGKRKELEEQAEALRTELKADLEEKGLDELQTANFVIRWKEIASSHLDSKALSSA